MSICNSDDAVLLLALRWIDRLTHKDPEFCLQYHHSDQDLTELRTFWGAALGFDSDAIRFQRKSNSGKLPGRQWRCSHGVLTARVHDTYLRARLQAWIDRLRSE